MSLLIETIRDPKLAELVIKTLETGNPLNKIENKYVMDILKASVIEATIAKEVVSGIALESDDFVVEQLENIFGKKVGEIMSLLDNNGIPREQFDDKFFTLIGDILVDIIEDQSKEGILEPIN